MKKKILFVIDSLQSGGAEKSLVSLLSLFDYKKYEVDLLMFSASGLYFPLLPKQVNVLDVPIVIKRQAEKFKNLIKHKYFKELFLRIGASISLRNPYINNNLHAAQIVWRWVSKGMDNLKGKYDVAIAYSQGMPTYFVANKVYASRKIAWVNTDYRLAAYNRAFDLEYYKKINEIVTVSDVCKDIFIREIPSIKSKVCVVYDIISPNLIKLMADEDEGFDDQFNGLRILTIGRLVYEKGYELAIEACYKLKKEGYQFKWYVIGEGNLKNEMESMIRKYKLNDTFILLGTRTNPYPYIKQSDIYVQPSRFEGYGLALAEARMFQKPIVATDFITVHNQIKDRENGLIVKMNSTAVYEGVKEIIENSLLKKRLCESLKKEQVGTEEEIEKIYALFN
ncbi:glycosyltransferase [Bacillus cereus]|uniref:Glycosyl transferase n=1 Tax=Bacillus cereus TaxID=1396 RepID=A0A2B9DJZ7_BACCE|nr:glycosyltransferase [Bacillus cereus]PGM87441.1 glycosyl transferase [Bacillus cereus]